MMKHPPLVRGTAVPLKPVEPRTIVLLTGEVIVCGVKKPRPIGFRMEDKR